MPHRPVTIALVGRRLPDNENLGIGHLQTALAAAGHRSAFHVLNSAEDLSPTAARIALQGASIVGLSLPDGGSAHLPLALGEMLRRRGWSGLIIAGGPFATLARHWLLERYDWLDGVIRHAGEIPLTALACRLADGGDFATVPGLTTRAGDGAPAPVLDEVSLGTWARRDEMPVLLGHGVANIATSRGCRGRCAYCGPASLQRSEIEEGRRLGASGPELARCGVGGVRRRDVDDLCDEMAHLWRERDVRYFNLVDEHPLPWHEDEALDFLGRWKRGLANRGVGTVGIGTMMRADRLTERLARAFVEVGLVRAFMGIELATPEEARLYSRPFMADRAAGMVRLLRSLGVATVTNVMLVHPASTLRSIRAGIDVLDSIPCAAETTRMQVYHGTRLHRDMASSGRLSGNPLRYGYVFEDDRVRGFDEIFTRLRVEAFGDHSAAYACHDMMLALSFARLMGREVGAGLVRSGDRVERRLRTLQVEALRDALVLAREGAGFWQCAELSSRVRERASALREQMDEITSSLSGPSSGRTVFSHVRAAAATALQVIMLGSGVVSCHGSHIVGDVDGHADAVQDVADEEVPVCTYEQTRAIDGLVEEAVREAVPCFTGNVRWSTPEPEAMFSESYMNRCRTDADLAIFDAREREVEAVVEPLDRSLDCELPSYAGTAYVYPGADDDVDRMMAAVDAACSFPYGDCGWSLAGIVVVVDASGLVVDVRAEDYCTDVTAEDLECIRAALEGLEFPCLAGMHVCPEPVLLD